MIRFKLVIICFMFILPSYAAAGILDELNFIPLNQDIIVYADLKGMYGYAQKKGIDPENLPYLMGEKQYQEFDDLIKNFELKLTDITEILMSGKVDETKKDPRMLMIIKYSGDTRKISNDFTAVSESAPYGIIYEYKESESKKFSIAQTKDSFIIGDKESVIFFLKSKKAGPSKIKKDYNFFKDQSRGKALYAHVTVSQWMKKSMDDAVNKGAKMGKGLESNVFLKSIMALQSMEMGFEIGETLKYHGGLRAATKEEGERLMMVSHFCIVGSSLAVAFLDAISAGMQGGRNNPGSTNDKEMEMVQKFFGRIGTRQVDRGVVLSFELTADEINQFVKKAEEKIEKEKRARSQRIEDKRKTPDTEDNEELPAN